MNIKRFFSYFTVFVLVINLFLCTSLQICYSSSVTNYEYRQDIPDVYKWNLEDIYKSKQEWESDCDKVKQLVDEFDKELKSVWTISVIIWRDYWNDHFKEKANILYEKLSKIYRYAYLSYDVDLSNFDKQEMRSTAENVYNYVKEKVLENKKIPLDDISDSYFTIYQMLAKKLEFPKISINGICLDESNLNMFLQNPDRKIRENAFKAYFNTYKEYQDIFAAALVDKIKLDNIIHTKMLDNDSVLSYEMTEDKIPEEVYENLIATVNSNLNLLQRYVGIKKKFLKYDSMHIYDMRACVVNNELESKYISYENAKNIAKSNLECLGKDYINDLENAMNSRWIDVYPSKDKTQVHQYNADVYGVHPYILLSYNGTLDDVFTLAHELGHAMHYYYTNKKQCCLDSRLPIFTAEVASTLNETLMLKNLYNKSLNDTEKLFYLEKYLEMFRRTFFRQTLFAEFEKTIYDKEKLGEPLSAGTLNKIYLELNKKYYGDEIIYDDELAVEWARVPHFYNGHYVYQYATSFAASQILADKVFSEGESAVEKIKENLFSLGSTKPPMEVLEGSGANMTDGKAVKYAMEIYKGLLDEYERLCEVVLSK